MAVFEFSPLAALVPERLERLIVVFTGYHWSDLGWSIAVLAVATVIGRIVVGLGIRALGRWSKRTETVIDDAISRHMHRPLRWIGPLVAVDLALPLVALPAGPMDVVQHVLLVLVIIGVGWLCVKAVRVAEDVVTARFNVAAADNLHAREVFTQMRGFRNVGSFVVIVVTLAFVLMTFEQVRQLGTGLLASAGVAGIVLGFAAQKSIATLLAGIQIAITQPIRVDDVVIVEGEWGKIEEITLTYVVVKIWDLRRLIVPIGYFIDKPFQNWTRTEAKLLGTVELRLDYSVPIDEVRSELKRILDASEHWDGETWGLQVTDADDRTILLRPLMSAKDAGEQWNLRCEVREKLITYVRENFPGALPRLRGELTQRTG